MAAELFADQVTNPDQAYPVMMRELLPAGLTGAMFAALFGAVMSSLDSMLNSAATIFSVDLYKRHLRPEASSRRLMVGGALGDRGAGAGRVSVGAGGGQCGERLRVHPDVLGIHLARESSQRSCSGCSCRGLRPLAAFGGMILGIPVYGVLLCGRCPRSRSCTTWRSRSW